MEDNKTSFTIIVNEDSVDITATNWCIDDAFSAIFALRNLINEQVAQDITEVEGEI